MMIMTNTMMVVVMMVMLMTFDQSLPSILHLFEEPIKPEDIFVWHNHKHNLINDQDSLASEDDLLCDPVAIVEEAVVGQGVLEHVDLSLPLYSTDIMIWYTLFDKTNGSFWM